MTDAAHLRPRGGGRRLGFDREKLAVDELAATNEVHDPVLPGGLECCGCVHVRHSCVPQPFRVPDSSSSRCIRIEFFRIVLRSPSRLVISLRLRSPARLLSTPLLGSSRPTT